MTTFPRTFTIHIEGCKNLFDRDGFGTGLSDPYVVVTHNKQQKHKTATVDNTLDPKWSEKDGSFAVTMDHKDSAVLTFVVWDEDCVGDEFLGQALLNMGETPASGNTVLVLRQREPEPDDEVTKAKGKLGTIHLKWTSVAVAVPTSPATVEQNQKPKQAETTHPVVIYEQLKPAVSKPPAVVDTVKADEEKAAAYKVAADKAAADKAAADRAVAYKTASDKATADKVAADKQQPKPNKPPIERAGIVFPGVLALRIVRAAGLKSGSGGEVTVDVMYRDALVHTLPNRSETVNPEWDDNDGLASIPMRKSPTEVTLKIIVVKKSSRSLVGTVSIDPAKVGLIGVLELPVMDPMGVNTVGGTVTLRWRFTSDVPIREPLAFPGTLALTVVSGTGLLNVYEPPDVSDPIVVIYKNKAKLFTTCHKDNTLNPIWNETAPSIRVECPEDLVFNLVCWDKESIGDSQFMGNAVLEIIGTKGSTQLILTPRNHEKNRLILIAKGKLGAITVSWVYIPSVATAVHQPMSVAKAHAPAEVTSFANVTSYPVAYTITIVKANGLMDRDSVLGGDSDPYVQMYHKRVKILETPVVNNNGNPVWAAGEATGTVTVCAKEDAVVTFMVWDKDTVADEFLGMVDFNTAGIVDQGTVQLALVPRPGETEKDVLDMKGNLGRLTLSWVKKAIVAKAPAVTASEWSEMKDPATGRSYYYNPKTGETTWVLPAAPKVEMAPQKLYPFKYEITVVRAKRLLNRDSGISGGSDPYVKIFQNKEKRLQTPVVKDSLNPVWEAATCMVTVTSVHDSIVSFTVWDEDTMNDEFLGTVDWNIPLGLKEHGTVELTLTQRPGESDKEVLAAKGNLGTLVVSWKCSGSGAPAPQMPVSLVTLKPTTAFKYPSTITVAVTRAILLPPGQQLTATIVRPSDGKTLHRSGVCGKEDVFENARKTIEMNGPEDAVVELCVLSRHAWDPEVPLGFATVDFAKKGLLTGTSEVALHPTRGGVPHPTMKIGIQWTVVEVTSASTSRMVTAVAIVEKIRPPGVLMLRVESAKNILARSGTTAVMVVSYDGRDVFRASAHEPSTTCPAWSRKDGTCEIRLTASAEPALRIRLETDERFLGHAILDARHLAVRGNDEILLCDRGKKEIEKDVIAAKGSLGSIRVAWKFIEGGVGTESDESHTSDRSLTAAAAPKKNELRLEVREVTRLMANDLVSVEVVVGSKTERSRQGSVDTIGTVFLGAMFAFPVVTPSHKLTLRVVCGDRVVGEGTLDVAPPRKGKVAHDGDVTLAIKGGVMNKEVCTVVLRWRYDYEDPTALLELPPSLSFGPQRGALLLEVREFVSIKKDSGAITAHYGASTGVVDRAAYLTVVTLGAATPCGVMRLVAKCGEGRVEIVQAQDGVVAKRTEGEGWVTLGEGCGRVYVRWALCFNIMALPVMDGEPEIELEVRAGRGLPDDLAVCIAVVPVTADRKPKAKPWTTRPSNKDNTDMEWAPDNRTGLNMCGAAEVVLQRGRDGANLASAKVVFPQSFQSWEGWVALRRGGTLGEVYIRWIRNTLTQNIRVRPRKAIKHSSETIYVTIVSGNEAIDTVPFDGASPVEDLKPILEQYTSVPIAQQVLYLSTQPHAALRGDKALCECLPEGATVCKIIVRASRGNITLRVSVPSGKTVFVTVQESEECCAIKKALVLEGAVAAPAKRMRLIFSGQEMSDELPVSYYRLKPMTMLYLNTAALNVGSPMAVHVAPDASAIHDDSLERAHREIADLTAKLRDSERRAREAEDLAKRAMERVASLEGALSRSHALMDKALMDGTSSPLRGSYRPNSTGGSNSSAYY